MLTTTKKDKWKRPGKIDHVTRESIHYPDIVLDYICIRLTDKSNMQLTSLYFDLIRIIRSTCDVSL